MNRNEIRPRRAIGQRDLRQNIGQSIKHTRHGLRRPCDIGIEVPKSITCVARVNGPGTQAPITTCPPTSRFKI